MSIILVVGLFAGGLFAGMLLFLEAGRRLGERRLEADPAGSAYAGSAPSRAPSSP